MTKILIVDASAVMGGFTTAYSNPRLISSTSVVKELKSRSSTFDLEERIPKQEIMQVVSEMNKDLQDNISEADRELLALAIEFRAPVVTDDYGIQNIAEKLGVEVLPVAQDGIKKIIKWEYYCPGCRRKSKTRSTCETCGTAIKRRAVK